MKMQWFTIYTKPRAEKKVSETLSRKKIENYFPLKRVIKNPNFPEKVLNEPLFSSYIFIRVTEKRLLEVKRMPGIVNLVYWLGKPVVINEAEITLIKRFLDEHVNVIAEKVVLGNETVKKIESSIVEGEGLLRSIVHNKSKIILPSLGYVISAESETSSIRIISSNNLIHQPKSGPSKLFNPVHSFYNYLKN